MKFILYEVEQIALEEVLIVLYSMNPWEQHIKSLPKYVWKRICGDCLKMVPLFRFFDGKKIHSVSITQHFWRSTC